MSEKPDRPNRDLEIHVAATFDRVAAEQRYVCLSCGAKLVIDLAAKDLSPLAQGIEIGNFMETHFHEKTVPV